MDFLNSIFSKVTKSKKSKKKKRKKRSHPSGPTSDLQNLTNPTPRKKLKLAKLTSTKITEEVAYPKIVSSAILPFEMTNFKSKSGGIHILQAMAQDQEKFRSKT